MKCPRCGSEDLSKCGHPGARQRYHCRACDRKFYEPGNIVIKPDSGIDLSQRFSPDELKRLLEPRVNFDRQTIDFSGDTVTIGAITDTHIGSRYTDDGHILSALEEFNRQGVDFIVHSGDVSEGMSGRDGHIYELTHPGFANQKSACIEIFKRAECPIYFISGNHDRWFLNKADIGADIVADVCATLPDAHYLGHDEGDILINGIVIRLWHGEDAGSYAISYRIQKIVESFSGGEKPNILICGHTHKSMYVFDRNIHCISAGCIQSQSKWMRGKRIAAHRGFWILRLTIADNEVKSFSPTWYSIY
jgi:predicted phosphodiesterase